MTVITVTAPAGGETWAAGSLQTLGWTLDAAVSAGDFHAWLIGDGGAGTWYPASYTMAVAGQTVYALDFWTTDIPADTYLAVVYHRPDLDVWGGWDADDAAAGTVTITSVVHVTGAFDPLAFDAGAFDTTSEEAEAAGVTVTPNLPASVPQEPDVVKCIQYEFDGLGTIQMASVIVPVTAGEVYYVAPYAKLFDVGGGASVALEVWVCDGLVETRTVSIVTLDADSDWERYWCRILVAPGEDNLDFRIRATAAGTDGSATLQLTAMHIVKETALSAYFGTTRVDSGIYGDAAAAAPGLPNEIAADNGIWVNYGPHRLYEGWLMTPQQTFTSDERWYVPAASYIERGKRNELFGRVYRDSDIAQWQAMENVPSWASMTNSGDKFRVLNTAGTPVPAADYTHYPVVYYWLMSGLRTDIHIDSVTFTLTKVGTPLFNLGVCSWAVPPNPAATAFAEAVYAPATADGPVTLPIVGAPGSQQAVGFFVESISAPGYTATVDNGWDITGVSVVTSAGTVDLGEALADLAKLVGIASGDALSTYTNTSISTLAARPVTTVSAAQDALVALAPVQLKWGYETKGIFDSAAAALPDRTSKGDRARWWSLSMADCTFTSDVVTDNEDFYDAVAVMYGAISVAGVTDGTVRVLYRGPGGVVAAPTATTRVRVLDYSGRYMTEAEAMAVGDSWLLWNGAGTGARGTQNISGDVRDVDGHVRPAIMIRPGDWVEERDRRGHTPWLVTGVSYEATGRVTVSVGGAERIFPVINPGVGGLYKDAALGTWAAEAAAGDSSYNENDPSGQLTDEYLLTHPWMATQGTGLGDYWTTHGATQYYLGAGGVSYNTAEEATASWAT